MRITSDIATGVATALLEGKRAPRSHALEQAGVLVEAELRGHPSHDLQRLPRILHRIDKGLVDPHAKGKAHWRTPSFLAVDGLRGLGPVVTLEACAMLAERVQSTGVVVAGIRSSNHLGMLAHYVEHLASKGIIGVPGDGAWLRRPRALREGIEISEKLWNELNALSPSNEALLKGHGQ